MAVFFSEASRYNKKPRSQWKDRFIYTMLGLFAGIFGVHNFYLGRRWQGAVQILLALLWIPVLSGFALNFLPFSAGLINSVGLLLIAVELLWVYLELLLVKKEPDGDFLNDEAKPVRILLTIVVFVAYILLPGLYYLYSYFVERPAREAEEVLIRHYEEEGRKKRAAKETVPEAKQNAEESAAVPGA